MKMPEKKSCCDDKPDLRDLFAMAALTGILARSPDDAPYCDDIAETAYEYADYMLAEREKK